LKLGNDFYRGGDWAAADSVRSFWPVEKFELATPALALISPPMIAFVRHGLRSGGAHFKEWFGEQQRLGNGLQQ
jgi:hypothetical protein